jgi:hypothetical protein
MHDEHPTATSAQNWLRELKSMTDRLLRDFSAAWGPIDPQHGGVRDTIPQSLHDETVALERQQKDAAVSVVCPGTSVVLQLDNYGNLTIMGGGRQHIEIPRALFDAGYSQLPAPASIPDPVQGPPASDTPIPGASIGEMSRTPPTNAKMSERQNELTANWLKTRKR